MAKLCPGTVVRITSTKKIFARGFHQKATTELFKVKSINERFYPATYKLEDLEGKAVEGTFYIK